MLKKLSIHQQHAELGIRTTPAQLRINQPRMKMKVSSQTPKMNIVTKAPTFKVNRKKLNSEMNISTSGEFAKEFRDKGKDGALRGVKNAVNDGNFLGNHKIQGDRISKLSRNKTMSAAMRRKESNIALMPKNKPEITWDKGSMSINWSKHSLVIDWDGDYMPQLSIDPKYNIEIFMRTEPYFRITVEELIDPSVAGQYMDRAI
jgi:hypothetical protein